MTYRKVILYPKLFLEMMFYLNYFHSVVSFSKYEIHIMMISNFNQPKIQKKTPSIKNLKHKYFYTKRKRCQHKN